MGDATGILRALGCSLSLNASFITNDIHLTRGTPQGIEVWFVRRSGECETGGNIKALIISADNFEDSELLVPYYRLKEAGIEVTVDSLKLGAITGKQGYEVPVDKTIDEVNLGDYAILVLPGGKAPAVVRKEPKALEIAKSFFVRNKPVAAICHGPQILISAGLLKGRRATCYLSVTMN